MKKNATVKRNDMNHYYILRDTSHLQTLLDLLTSLKEE